MKRACGLIRVSSEDQKDEGYGIPEQVEKISTYIHAHGYFLVESTGFSTEGIEYIPGFFQEDHTGKTAIRPAILALFDAIDAHRIQVVVVHRTNRLGRRDAVQQVLEADFKARGVRVEYVNTAFDLDTPGGRFMRRIYSNLDELDYENIINQLRNGREQAAKKGSVVLARPPYGYSVVKQESETGRVIRKLEIVEHEATIVQQIFQWYVYDGQSMSSIAAMLTEMKVPTRWDSAPNKRGIVGGLKKRKYPAGVWDDSTVQKILHNETYIGRWAWGTTKTVPVAGTDKVKQIPTSRDTWVIVPCPAIIDTEVFLAVQRRTEENQRLNPRHRKFTFLFSGMLTCDNCKRAYNGTRWSATSPYRYRCGGKRGKTRYIEAPCTMPNFAEDEIDGVIWPWVKEIVSNPSKIEQTLTKRQMESEQENAQLLKLIQSADTLIEELKNEQERVLTLYKKGKLDEQRWEAEDSAYTTQIAQQEQQRAKLLSKTVTPLYPPEYLDDIKQACQWITEGMEYFIREEKRKVYELLLLTARIAQEGNEYVLYAECILDARRLSIKGGNEQSDPSISSSSTPPWPAPARSTRSAPPSARR